jgi:hypothetical protein
MTSIRSKVISNNIWWPYITTAVIVFGMAARGQNPVTDWNLVAVNATSNCNPAISPGCNTAGGAGIYLAYVHLAMYDAVNAINRRFQSYGPDVTAPANASPEAAAIAAAYYTLTNYFPDQADLLMRQYQASLSIIPDGAAKDSGVQAGQAAAAGIIKLRSGDGRGADVLYTYPSAPTAGVWIPTPPGFLAPQTPWVGQMRPLTMDSPDQFLPPEPPPSLTSAQWADDYNEVKNLGAANSPVRTRRQTEIGLFWTEPAARQYSRAFRSLAIGNGLDIYDTARLFAMLWTASTDSFIGCMNAKYHFSFWRPVTAIQNAGLAGNAATLADPAWVSLGTTPNHPEYPAAHGCLTGAVAATLEGFFGTPDVGLIVSSTVTNTTHVFTHVSQLEREVFGARIYAGFHYRHSLEQGFLLGHRVAGHLLDDYFQPVNAAP